MRANQGTPVSIVQSLQHFCLLQDANLAICESSTPLSCYWDSQSQSVLLIASSNIEAYMRSLAVLVCGFKPDEKEKDHKDVMRWSAHSLHVGACVILHCQGFSPLDIQWLLQWHSQAFVACLRNLSVLSDQHNAALNRHAAVPCLA